ncbi:MAG: tetratricopeptide repeat protein, partial [Sinobacteraceae bacterium]|nr:tetratricopeptide repeat protein [Nevskiaceae bacterium]
MYKRFSRLLAAAILCTGLGLLQAGCSSTPSKDGGPSTDESTLPKRPVGAPPLTPRQRAKKFELEKVMKLKAPKLYQDAHKKLINGSYADAVKEFDHLITQYPFSRYATQARLENIYAEYRSYKYDQAMSDAALFLRDHPRYPHADYAL